VSLGQVHYSPGVMKRFLAVKVGRVARKIRDVNVMKKAIKDCRPVLHYLFGCRGWGGWRVSRGICALLGMTSPIGERECPLICNMLRLCFHSGRCGSFAKETTPRADCTHKTRPSAHFYGNRRHSFAWGESDERILDFWHKIFLGVPTNTSRTQKHNRRRVAPYMPSIFLTTLTKSNCLDTRRPLSNYV
jgi:hypothetical protein